MRLMLIDIAKICSLDDARTVLLRTKGRFEEGYRVGARATVHSASEQRVIETALIVLRSVLSQELKQDITFLEPTWPQHWLRDVIS